MRSETSNSGKLRWLIVWIIYGVIAGLFFGGKYIVESRGMEYREYVSCLGCLILWTGPWVFGLIALIKYNRRKMLWDEREGWTAGGIAALVIYMIVMLFLSGVMCCYGLLHLRTEERVGNVIVVQVPHFLQPSEVYYCDPVGPFARKEFTWDGEREQELLEEEYGMEFTVLEDTEGNRSYIPEQYPQIRVTIENQVPLQDDFSSRLAAWYFENTYKEQNMQTAWASEGINGYRSLFYLKVNDRAELKNCAQDVAALIEAACQDPFFDTHEGWLNCILEENGYTHVVSFYFGAYKPFVKDGKRPDYYADSDTVLSRLYQEWKRMEDDIAKWSDHGQNARIPENEDFESDSQENVQSDSQEHDLEELPGEEARIVNAAQCLYEVLKGSPDGFEESYNAKGNLYVDIEMAASDSEDSSKVRRRIVFDRMSENGRCYLFALYEGETMVDYYAVNITTEEVTASGKHAYADTGSKAYQEATGEP